MCKVHKILHNVGPFILACLLVSVSMLTLTYGQVNKKTLHGVSPQERVRQLLIMMAEDDDDAIKETFKMGDEAVPTLVRALRNKELRVSAAQALAYIGNRRSIEALRSAIKVEKGKEPKSLMSAYLAGALVEITSKSDLDFLSGCIEKYRDEEGNFQAVNAALSLGIMRTGDALKILRRAKEIDEEQIPDNEIAKAIRWIEKSSAAKLPTTPLGSDEEEIKKIIFATAFYAEGEEDKLSLEEIVFNGAKDRALVSVRIYHGPKDARGYDIVLRKSNGTWRVAGIWFAWIA